MDMGQVVEKLIGLEARQAASEEKIKVANNRLKDVEALANSIHENTACVRELAVQVGHLTEKLDDSLDDIKAGQKAQGERIGALESKPAKRWDAVVTQLIGILVAAVAGGLIAQFAVAPK